MNITFFSLRCDLFSIIAKEVNQIRNLWCNVVCVVTRLVFLFLLCTHYGQLQCFSTYFYKLKEIGVLRPKFPDYVISCDYVAIDLTKQIEFENSVLNQEINFNGKLEDDEATMLFIIEKLEETTCEFSKNSVSII